MSECHFDEIRRFVTFDAADERALVELHAIAEPSFHDIVDEFYAQIATTSAARAVLRDERQTQRLKLSLRGWLSRILSGPWGDQFIELQNRIGRVHVKVGLPQRFMLTAMSVVRRRLHDIVEDRYADNPDARRAAHRALARVLDLDLALMLDSYREDSIAALRRLEEVERKLIAQELEVSEERCRAVLETAEVIAVAINNDGEVRLFNRHAELVTGYSRTEMLRAADLESIWHPAELDAAQAALEATRAGTASQVAELRIVTRKGEPRWIRWHVTKLPSTGDGEVCFIGVDLTAERLFAERTRRAETLATIGTLAAGLAHEIRNPLNAAQLQLTLAERRLNRSGTDAGLEQIRVVRQELGRLATLVQDFLAYARPAPLRVSAVDLAETGRQVIELLAPTAGEAKVDLTLDCLGSVTAEVDEERIRQVLINLVHNAVDAAGEGGDVVLHIERYGPSALLEVSDSGEGFADDIEIFEPFATSKESGTGLGLSIVRRIVNDHLGSIRADRTDDRTVFRIELPTVAS